MTPVVLDKNFLQGKSFAAIRKLLDSHKFLMSDSLFYELMTTDLNSRRSCFVKLLGIENPVALVPRPQVLVQEELRTRTRSPLPSERAIALSFRFNVGLLEPTYTLAPSQSEALMDEVDDVDRRVDELIERALSIETMYPKLFMGNDQERKAYRSVIEHDICSDQSIVESVYQLFALDQNVVQIDGTWALVRYVQTQLLMAIDIIVRHRGQLHAPINAKIRVGIEHDLHDSDFLVLSALEGRAATCEKKLQRMLRMLRKDIELLG